MGLLDRHRRHGPDRHGPGGSSRPAREPAHARRRRRVLARAGNVLAARAGRLWRHRLPRRRHRRLALGQRLHVRGAARPAERGLRPAPPVRGGRGPAALLRPAPARRSARARRVPGLDLHLPGLRQPRARQPGRRVPRPHADLGRGAEPRRLSRIRPLHLQPARRRQRHRLLLAPAPDPDHAAGLPHLTTTRGDPGCGTTRPTPTSSPGWTPRASPST